MRASQRALLAALAFVLLVAVVSTVWLRVQVSPAEELSGGRATLAPALTNFSGIEVSGGWELDVVRGDSWRVELEVPSEVQGRVEAGVVDGRLQLRLSDGLWLGPFGDQEFSADITLPRLESLTVFGASEIDFSGFEGGRLEITVSGAAEIDGSSSRLDALKLTLTGAGDVNLREVPVTDAEVAVTGAGTVELRMAGGRLTGQMAGAASLEYFGSVSEQSVATSGPVVIRRAGP
jgi:hypothetical protein